MSRKPILTLLPPEQIILFSICLTILISSLLLSLPMAQVKPCSLLDLIFTTTSATCVVGIFTVPLENFTFFGQTIILILIQIGGLGLITLTLFFLNMITNMGIGTHHIAGQILEIETWPQIRRVLYLIIMVTLISELLGALLILSAVSQTYPFGHACFISLFHAVSSFCSAGITVFDCCLSEFKDSNLLIITTIILMYIGGLGFITWQELGRYFKAQYHKKPYRFSLHSKIILYGSSLLLFASTIMIWILEYKNVFCGIPLGKSILESVFYAVSFRSTGFLLTTLSSFHLATILLIMVIAFIGSAPGSTGSGVKITTFAIFAATVKAAIVGQNHVTLKGRQIPISQVFRSIGIVSAGIGWIVMTTFFLLVTEPGFTFLEVLFETVNAFTSLGAPSGISAQFTDAGKIFIIMSMIIGRIGSFSLILALKLRTKNEPDFSYPEERVMLG